MRLLPILAALALGAGCSKSTGEPTPKPPKPRKENSMKAPLPGKNRLASEKSPYLLQHANNPVDWYPWGEEAFEKAKREDKRGSAPKKAGLLTRVFGKKK